MEITGAPHTYRLKPGEVHAWLVELGELREESMPWKALLSEEEITRSERFHFEPDRLRFIARRGILRQLLGRYCGIPPREIKYDTNPFGKLSLPSGQLSFNLSKSGERVVYAFTQENSIGVDIERVRPLQDLAQLAESWFSKDEQTGLSVVPPSLQLEAFYHVWTEKEAFIKAHGEGLSHPLDGFSVSVDPHLPGRLVSFKDGGDDPGHWKISCQPPEPGWRTTACVSARTTVDVQWYRLQLTEVGYDPGS